MRSLCEFGIIGLFCLDWIVAGLWCVTDEKTWKASGARLIEEVKDDDICSGPSLEGK